MNPQGDILDILGGWTTLIFLGAAECEIRVSTGGKSNHIDRRSGNDPPCVGFVQSIKTRPWPSPHVVRHRSHWIFSVLYSGRYSA